MGVPVVSLAGATHVSRVGFSVLSQAGLPCLVAHSPEEYVELAVRLSSDIRHLRELRTQLRARVSRSLLTDARATTRAIEAAYRTMWQTWVRPN